MALFEQTSENVHNTHNVNITSKINQLSKGQDYIYIDDVIDITGEECKLGVVFDGHGEDLVINFIRSIPKEQMNKLLVGPKPIESVANYINDSLPINSYSSSGSTMCMVKIYSTRIECINCGDSQVAVYKNGSLEFISKEHNFENQKERERLKTVATFIPSANIKITNHDTLISVYSEYIEWDLPNSYTKLACSQSLGHYNATGYDPDYTVIPITQNDKFKVVMGSDGLWDMMIKEDEQDMNALYNMNAQAIAEHATTRWLQMWNMHDVLNNKDSVKCRFTPNQADDVAVFVADIDPVQPSE